MTLKAFELRNQSTISTQQASKINSSAWLWQKELCSLGLSCGMIVGFSNATSLKKHTWQFCQALVSDLSFNVFKIVVNGCFRRTMTATLTFRDTVCYAVTVT